jgi:hypothetical protein
MLLTDNKLPEKYVWSGSSTRFTETSSIGFSKVFKNEGSAVRFIDEFNQHKTRDRYDLLRNKYLTYRKLTRQEWDLIVDNEQSRLKYKYEKANEKIEKKRRMFK